jgi:hypothetical protein
MIKYHKLLPDCKALDYFISYIKHFGLHLDIDEDKKTIKLLTRDEFYGSTKPVIKDWTNKFALDKEYNITPLNFDKKYIELKYKDGNTTPIKEYKERNGYAYGSVKLNTGYEFNEDSYDYFKGTIFESTICVAKNKYIYMKVI